MPEPLSLLKPDVSLWRLSPFFCPSELLDSLVEAIKYGQLKPLVFRYVMRLVGNKRISKVETFTVYRPGILVVAKRRPDHLRVFEHKGTSTASEG